MPGLNDLISAAFRGGETGPAPGENPQASSVFSNTGSLGMSPEGMAELGAGFANPTDGQPRIRSSRAERLRRRGRG